MNMTMSLTSVIVILIGHWIGDYVLQTNIIAKDKSRSFKWLLIHVALYTVVISICAVTVLQPEIWFRFIAINGVLHLITDFFTSRLASNFHSNKRVYFVILGFDQMVHSITLLTSAYLLST